MNTPTRRQLLLAAMVVFLIPASSHAALSLTVDSFTLTSVTLSISGTFDANVGGDQDFWLAVKSDWTNNYGKNTNWFDGGAPTIDSNTITINGEAPANTLTVDGETYGDSIYIMSGVGSILAGMTVSGSVTMSGSFVFPASNTLDLLSGFDETGSDWNRLEATATIPEPAESGLIAGAAALALLALRRRR